ncbi:MAG: hypothetical protein PWP04_85 [Candidatus Atribacteria bacterium]|nr:hypothetical protein [Candidatus Atribacteria bacterium]
MEEGRTVFPWRILLLMVLVFSFLGMRVAYSAQVYSVKKGDTLWSIARRYQVPLDLLEKANGLSGEDVLPIGFQLTIPTSEGDIVSQNESKSNEYIVQAGDNLWDISRKFDVPLKSLLESNNLSEKSILRVGQKLKIPSSASLAQKEPPQTSTLIHRVEKGESLWVISRHYGVSMESIMSRNHLNPDSILAIGMELVIPTSSASSGQSSTSTKVEGFYYQVQKGDSLWTIAQKFGTSVDALSRANQLTNPEKLSISQSLWIPSAQRPAGASGEYQTYQVRAGDTLWSISRSYGVALNQLMSINGLNEKSVLQVGQNIRIPLDSPRGYGSTSTSFIWPVSGRVTSPFGSRGGRLHSGIDISAPSGKVIYAARSGIVSFSGWQNGYGRVVIIDHQDGWQTVYAHNSLNLVTRGQRVNQGDPIARVGNSGNATGFHLHFEIRNRGQAVDPLQHLRR